MSAQTILIFTVIYLGAAVLMVPLAKRLGLGSVLGYLVAGLVIGPSGFGLISQSEQVLSVAEFGIVMMLFLAGLELQPERLWSLRRAAFGLGTAQVVTTALVVAGVAFALGMKGGPAVAIGLSFAMSSTAIVLQGLTERGQLKTSSGETSFAVLLFQDLAVVPILAVMPVLAPHAVDDPHAARTLLAHLPAWAQPLGIFGAVAVIFFGGRVLTRPLFRLIARTRLREVFTASALFVVTATALIMASVGLSPAMGAFLGGVVLADSEFRHELESDIEPFKGLLLGLFFISIGANIDVTAMVSSPLLIAAIVVGVVAIKAGIVFVLMRLFGYRPRDALAGALALSQVGEFAFLLVSVGLRSRLFDNETAGILNLVVTLTMVSTPLLFVAFDRCYAKGRAENKVRDNDVIAERNRVILAGFGRVGQVAARLLIGRGIPVTILEHDDEQLDGARRFGSKVYYGDARREAVMRAAGAGEAALLIVATDVPETTREIVEMAKRDFPNLRVIARAFDRVHAYELEGAGADAVVRETHAGALELGVEAMKALGYPAFEAGRLARVFRRHDAEGYRTLRDLRGDRDSYASAFRAHREELDKVLARDRAIFDAYDDGGWDVEELIDEAEQSASGR